GLQRVPVADDEQRVSEPLELPFERSAVEPVALDHEGRAVAKARELPVHRCGRKREGGRWRGKLLARDGRREPTHELHEPGGARAIAAASISRAEASFSAAPRTIWERITPEFPRALISAARETSAASASRLVVVDFARVSAIPRTVSRRFVPVSPSGTG